MTPPNAAEIAIRKLHPSNISDEAFSVIKHLDDARVLIAPRTTKVVIFNSESCEQ